MGDDGADFGDFGEEKFLDLGEVGDAGDDEEALPATIMFAQQGFADDDAVPGHDIGADREAIDRRGLNDRQFAQARHRHLQRARDRRGGQGEDMDVGLQGLQPFLVGDAEALFLINNDEAEPLEVYALGQQRMGADNDIDGAVGEASLDRLRLLVGDEARKAADIDREAAEAFLELHMMLAGEQGGGADEDDLHPRHRRDEGGAQGDLGFAEADIAADEAIHRLARSQILDHVADRAVLIFRFLIGEAIDKGGVARDIGFGDGGGAQRAFGGGLEQFTRDFADALLHLGLAPLPGFAAELVEADAIAVRPVAGEDFEIFDRHEQLVAARIAQGDAVMRRLADRDLGQSFIAANAMVHVDDEVAGRQGGEFRKEGVGILLALGAADEPVAQHILFSQDRDIGGGKAMVERQDGQRHAAIGGGAERFLPAIGGGEALDAMVE